MNCLAAVMTGKGTGAISTIQLFGDSAGNTIKQIFEPAGKGQAKFETGQILLGKIHDNKKTIDQVTIGCEQDRIFTINCHGNPLIVEMIMQLLKKYGVDILSPDQLQIKILSEQENGNTIAAEAKLYRPKAKTLEGTKIIVNQVSGGLSKTACRMGKFLPMPINSKPHGQRNLPILPAHIKEIPLEEIRKQASQILFDSQIAKLIIYGCTAVLAGPPNSGKSSLLNSLSGREKAIVTDIKGTTRDWVSSQCRLDRLSLELIDTAGLEEQITPSESKIEKAAQKKTTEIIEKADLILLVLDNSQPADQLEKKLIEKITDKKIITVLNKSDLPCGLDTKELPEFLSNTVLTSAKEGTGIEELTEKIRLSCGVVDFDLQTAVCFTERQEKLLKKLAVTESRQQAASTITELLTGRLS